MYQVQTIVLGVVQKLKLTRRPPPPLRENRTPKPIASIYKRFDLRIAIRTRIREGGRLSRVRRARPKFRTGGQVSPSLPPGKSPTAILPRRGLGVSQEAASKAIELDSNGEALAQRLAPHT